jgi:hypothetical protein
MYHRPVDQLQSEIAVLQQAIAALATLPEAQRPLMAQLADKERQFAALQLQTGGVNLGSAQVETIKKIVG